MLRYLTLLICICISVQLYAQKTAQYNLIGDSLLKEKKISALLDYFAAENKSNPENEIVLRWLGYGYFLLDSHLLAEKYYMEAIKVNPKCAKCHMYVGRFNYLKDDTVKAAQYLNKAIDLDNTIGRAFMYRGDLNQKTNQTIRAMSDYDQAVQLDTTDIRIYLARGEFNDKIGFTSSALADFTKAIQLAPDFYLGYYLRSNCYYDRREIELAYADINQAILLDSMQSDLYLGKGAILEVLEKYAEAVNTYSKGIALAPDDYMLYFNRSSAKYRMEDLDGSCEDLEIVYSHILKSKVNVKHIIDFTVTYRNEYCDNNKPSYYYQRGIAAYNVKEIPKAIRYYEEGLQKFPQNSLMFTFLGNAYLEAKEYDKAISSYSKAHGLKSKMREEIKEHPQLLNLSKNEIEPILNGISASNFYNSALCNFYLNNFEEALSNLDTGILLMKKGLKVDVDYYYILKGHIHMLHKEYDLAEENFMKSISMNPKSDIAYCLLAVLNMMKVEQIETFVQNPVGRYNYQPVSVTWNIPRKVKLSKIEDEIKKAILYCNKAIEVNKDSGFAFYIRGQLKFLLNQSDYCIDLLAALSYSISIEPALVNSCD